MVGLFVGVFIGVLFIGLFIYFLYMRGQTMNLRRKTVEKGKGYELQMTPIVTVDNKSSPNKILAMPH